MFKVTLLFPKSGELNASSIVEKAENLLRISFQLRQVKNGNPWRIKADDSTLSLEGESGQYLNFKEGEKALFTAPGETDRFGGPKFWLDISIDQKHLKHPNVIGFGRFIAEIAAYGCETIICTTTGTVQRYTRNLETNLLSESPALAFEDLNQRLPAKLNCHAPELLKARAEAHKHWPEFVSAFKRRQSYDRYFVTALFSEGNKEELLWIEVSAIKPSAICGKLTNTPLKLRSYHVLEEVIVPIENIYDWQYSQGKDTVGDFTLAYMLQHDSR